ncbi:MAG: hypothetical protein K8U03_08600 [Planctomycetia bacterium]|nr:hypothetical protein [Planctomycetia bacterium]
MGLDFVSVFLEFERQFGVRLESADLRPEFASRERDLTAGRLHEIICEKCKASNIPVSRSSWNRFRWIIAKTLGIKANLIRRETWLRRELDFS